MSVSVSDYVALLDGNHLLETERVRSKFLRFDLENDFIADKSWNSLSCHIELGPRQGHTAPCARQQSNPSTFAIRHSLFAIRFGSGPLAQLGSCDFVGDGRQDRFMATGVTWWAYSTETNQWRYLNTMPENMPRLQLVDLDSDGRCDVAERPSRPEVPFPRYSKSGTAPRTPRVGGEVGPNS
jgi:hypothetical protein